MIWIFLKVEQCTHFQMNHQLRNYFSALCSWSMACWNMALGNVQNCLTRLLTATHGSHVLSLSCALYVPHFTFGLNFWVFFFGGGSCGKFSAENTDYFFKVHYTLQLPSQMKCNKESSV
mgnify:CR=1 FL=1